MFFGTLPTNQVIFHLFDISSLHHPSVPSSNLMVKLKAHRRLTDRFDRLMDSGGVVSNRRLFI